MQKVQLAVAPLRVLLALTFVFLVAFQVGILPASFAHMAEEFPDLADLRWPMLVVSVLVLVCVEVVIVCTWKLLTMVEDDRIFSEASLVWVDGIIWAIGAAWLLVLTAFVYFLARWQGPGFPVMLTLLLMGGAVLALLILVMRELLRQATTLRTDMDAVI